MISATKTAQKQGQNVSFMLGKAQQTASATALRKSPFLAAGLSLRTISSTSKY